MAILAKRARGMREVEMWPGMVVSLIDRPWSRVLRAGRGRTSLAWDPAEERTRGREDERKGLRSVRLCADGSERAVCVYEYTRARAPPGCL